MRILVGTRKGLFRLERLRDGWHVSAPKFLGVPVLNAMRDGRDGALWACLGHGHWGPKLAVSRDDFDTFTDVDCPKFPDGCEIDTDTPWGKEKTKATVKALYTIVPADRDGSFWIGTDPGGMFRSDDGGETWALHEPLWKIRNEHGWFAGGGGTMLHAILPQPDRPERIHIGISCAGTYESKDGGATWEPRNQGVIADFLPDKYPEVGQDVHMLARAQDDPDVLWQQNHCGNYRSTDGGLTWTDMMPDGRFDIGFGVAMGGKQTAWTVPMESDEKRVALDGALVVMRTDDGGETWQELRSGLPQKDCYDIVYRHALDAQDGLVAFGTTCGRVFVSEDRGDSWTAVAPHLPMVNSVTIER